MNVDDHLDGPQNGQAYGSRSNGNVDGLFQFQKASSMLVTDVGDKMCW